MARKLGLFLKEKYMPKVDFSRVEFELELGISRMKADFLRYLADLNSSFGTKEKAEKKLSKKEQLNLLATQLYRLVKDLKKIQDSDKEALKKLGIKPSYIKKLVDNPSALTDEQWNQLKEIRVQIDEYKKEIKKKLEPLSDLDLIAKARKKQRQARFNTNDNWLPLH